MNPPQAPPRRGTVRTRRERCSPLGKCKRVGRFPSESPFRFFAYIGTMNRLVLVLLLVLETITQSRTRTSRTTRTKPRFMESPHDFGAVHWGHEPVWVVPSVRSPAFRRPRLKPELQTGGSWKASAPFLPCTGTMNPRLTPPKRGTERTQRNAAPLSGCVGDGAFTQRLRRFNVARHCDHGLKVSPSFSVLRL